MSNPTLLPATRLAAMIRAREISPVELVEASLARIAAVQPVNNPFALILADEARAGAEAAERALVRGEPVGALHGLPVAFKDFTPTLGHRTTRGSVAYENWVADSDPVIVRRFKAAGAIIVGKTTTPEFAHSGFTRSPLFGHTTNPWDATKSAGGSSGGAGVAVTTGCVALAEGTDMGGSVRIPAALCGCVGLKPSLGRIPMDILPTIFDDMSHFGPLARTVEDAGLFLRVAEGPDPADIWSQRVPVPLPDRLDGDVRGLRIALSHDLGFMAVDAEVATNLDAVAAALADAGAIVTPVALPWGVELVEAWNRWWGVYLAAAFGDLLAEHRARMDPKVVRLIEAGQRLDAVSFARIDQLRTRQWHALATVFAEHDALICPTMAVPAPDREAGDGDFDRIDERGRLHGLDMTGVFNMVGQCPALSVPSGMTASGLPTAVQIVADRFRDDMALRIGAAVERLRPWRGWTPTVA
jgi:Asp-tRNA(Asn)/Glu-tRNA(Gln) amidotransferase A subunit family amidase